MSNKKKQLAILGSTGSIGVQTLSIVKDNPNLFESFLLSANSNHALLLRQAKVFKPKHVVINSQEGYTVLKKNLNPETTTVSLGLSSLCDLM